MQRCRMVVLGVGQVISDRALMVLFWLMIFTPFTAYGSFQGLKEGEAKLTAEVTESSSTAALCDPEDTDACLRSASCTVESVKDRTGQYVCRASKSPCETGFRQSVDGRRDCEAIGGCRFVPGECFCPPLALCACGGGPPPRCLPASP